MGPDLFAEVGAGRLVHCDTERRHPVEVTSHSTIVRPRMERHQLIKPLKPVFSPPPQISDLMSDHCPCKDSAVRGTGF